MRSSMRFPTRTSQSQLKDSGFRHSGGEVATAPGRGTEGAPGAENTGKPRDARMEAICAFILKTAMVVP
jgi:hypothetical protein